MKYFFAALIAFFTAPVQAMYQGFSFSGGLYQMNMFTLTRSETGSSDAMGDTYLPLGFNYSMEVMAGWNFQPSIHFSYVTTLIVPKETPEDGAKKNILFVNLPVVTNIREGFDFKAGLGVLRYEIKGDGGTIQLANGNSTATFYQPSRTSTAYTGYFLFGSTFPVSAWQLDVDLMINAPGDSNKRSYSMYVYLTQPFGLGDGL
jgi:hypothetical protein